ncbi:N-acyl homoserine lactonase family protein [Amycolatopsis acidicola]|uniref:N-acyl homoserine lactonase family protein n=2 Tax=Amycolatopsis acidicola TaxID=2596893 RepID=A0A5N0UKA8_9PSEU|nr:N-acyl homoserine lactonase family protein [Amycolatopsis acidicola]
MPMDYFVWVLAGEDRTVVVDTGYGPEEALRRGRVITRPVADGLRALDVEPSRVTDVILTHLHWDHAGNLGLFGNARFHVQEAETRFAFGPAMADQTRSSAYAPADIAELVHLVHGGRVRFAGADEELFPGIEVHLVGGHTAGTQVVRVRTASGPVLLASDAAHFYANLDERRVFAVTHDPGQLLDVYAHRFPALVDSADDIIPGHDPLVLRRYPAAAPTLTGWVARLDR